MIGEENGKHIKFSPPALTPIHNLPYLQRYIPRLSSDAQNSGKYRTVNILTFNCAHIDGEF